MKAKTILFLALLAIASCKKPPAEDTVDMVEHRSVTVKVLSKSFVRIEIDGYVFTGVVNHLDTNIISYKGSELRVIAATTNGEPINLRVVDRDEIVYSCADTAWCEMRYKL